MPKEAKQYRLESETIAEIGLYSRLQRMDYTTFVEQAVLERIKQARQDTGVDSREVAKHAGQDGAVLCKLFALGEKQPLAWSPAEQKMREFVRVHAAFFYDHQEEPRHEAMRFLWPQIDGLVTAWERDYWAPGLAMQRIYRDNKIEPPLWPPNEVKGEDNGKRNKERH